MEKKTVQVRAGGVSLEGDLTIPDGAEAVVLFAHGSGSSRQSSRNRYVAGVLNQRRLATLLFDLLTPDEERIDLRTAELRFDIPMLADRVRGATEWLWEHAETKHLTIGYFGASTGAGAALIAASRLRNQIGAVVSRGGRPDLAGDALVHVTAPTLLIVGGRDYPVIEMNQWALDRLGSLKQLEIVSGATHLFEEEGTLEKAAALAADWFATHLHGPNSEIAGNLSGRNQL